MSPERELGTRGSLRWEGRVPWSDATQTLGFGAPSLVPGMVVLSLFGPIMVHRVARHLSAWTDPHRPGGEGVVVTALALQFLAILSAAPVGQWLSSVISVRHLVL